MRPGALFVALIFAGCAQQEPTPARPGPAVRPQAPKPVKVARPQIVSPADWGSRPQPIARAKAHTPNRITIHHAGVEWTAAHEPFKKILGLQGWGQREKSWPDVPYHFLIAPDGRIFAGRDLAYAGETNTEYDTRGHALVHLWGHFDKQRVRVEQLRATVRLVAWLCQSRRIAPASIAGHKDSSKQTSCPGRDLYRYVQGGDLRRWVEQTLAGATPEVALRAEEPDGPQALVPLGAPR